MHTSVDVLPVFINMAIVWDDETIFKLIEIFETKRVLWDCSTKDYKNKIKKNDAWEDISKALEIPQKDIESKIHILRSQFAREKKKVTFSKSTGVGTADTEKSKWKFYDALKFLLNVMTSRGGSDTISKTANQEDVLETEQSLEPGTSFKPPTSMYSSSKPQTLLPSSSSQKTAKRKMHDSLNEIFDIVKFAKRKMHETKKDEYDIYGQYVASELREVKNANAVLQAKSYINNILIDMRMGKFNYSYGYHSHPRYSYETTSTSSTHNIDNIEELVSQIDTASETDSSTQ